MAGKGVKGPAEQSIADKIIKPTDDHTKFFPLTGYFSFVHSCHGGSPLSV
jgi:hypothetical protein